ncbi:serine hydrolase domain-containing protein [Pseudoalteromonas sp. OOF1S-7]|uniref:serine hydrolase domain-containing protein n=1 Tax=Pseudoalteromonas sp. OOF1S-7 TaxID=2917757 RepID=UPI001EF5451A|nr:serine hydrolase domain-containing protein [Pseudoalteromonas sp. OOF1S-7]MCG7536129.1 beta-lactamase family protein [Pseudoalteromonas sp. OOF1S-7]
MKHLLSLLTLLLVTALVYFGWPVYQFFAFNLEKVPVLASAEPLPTGPLPRQQRHSPALSAFNIRASDILRTTRAASNAPGISAAIAHRGQLVWQGTLGYADIATKTALTPEHQFRIGSTSKAVTATLMAKLIQAHHFNLDTPLKDSLVPLPNPAWRDITPRQLASHSAGLPHYKGNQDPIGLYHSLSLNTQFDRVIDAVAQFDEGPLRTRPGDAFYYSSYGTVLLSAVLAQHGQRPYLELLQQHVLTPLGMTRSGAESQANKLVTFYFNRQGQDAQYIPWRPVNLSHRLAGGGLVSTPGDLVRLGSGYLDTAYLHADVREQIWTPQRLNHGEVNPQNYALGWRRHEYQHNDQPAFTYYHHGGVSRGSQSMLIVVPRHQLSVAVNINSKTKPFRTFGQAALTLAHAYIQQLDQAQRDLPDTNVSAASSTASLLAK